jgi:hypothetical protein
LQFARWHCILQDIGSAKAARNVAQSLAENDARGLRRRDAEDCKAARSTEFIPFYLGRAAGLLGLIVVVRMVQPIRGLQGRDPLPQFLQQFRAVFAEILGPRFPALLSQIVPQFDKLLEPVLGRGIFIAHGSVPYTGCGGWSAKSP